MYKEITKNISDIMNDIEEMEDMIEIENIKQEPQLKEEIENIKQEPVLKEDIDLSCNEELDYLSLEKLCNADLKASNLKTTTIETFSLSIDNKSENSNRDNCILLTKNPLCDIQIANISYTRNTNICDVSNIELQEAYRIMEDESGPENAIDSILFQCEDCNKPAKCLADHTYTKPSNRLKLVVENEEKKDIDDQVYTCKFCPIVVDNPQKYLLHLQAHESEDCTCRSCHENLKVSDLLNVHMLIKFRTCEICRKVFTSERGYRQHLKIHYQVPKNSPVTKKNLDLSVQTVRFEEITIKEEDHGIDPEVEAFGNNKEILPNREDSENVTEGPETSDKNGTINNEVDPGGSGEKDSESCQPSFSRYVKSWNNTDREKIFPENIILKNDDVWTNKESSAKNERNEDAAPTLSTEDILEIQEIHVVKPSKGLDQPKISNPFEGAIPRHKIEEVIFLFECAGCARNFVSKKSILEHVTKKHTEDFRLWETLYIKKKLADKKPMQTLTANEGEVKYTCRFCPAKFHSACKYSNHLKIHHICNHCDKIFSSQQLLEDHKCEFPKSLICHICNKPFAFKNNYIAHLNTHENDCEICKQKFTSESLLTIHRKHVHPEGICFVCHRWFSSESLLQEHRTRLHDISVMNFTCWICEKNIRSERKFRAHMEVHGDKRPFSCHHCGKCYARYLAMTAHSERCDLFDERKVFECDICKKAFYDKKKFVPHMKHHFESDEMPPPEKLSVEDQKILKLINDMKNTKGSKNSRSPPNNVLYAPTLNADGNLKRLSVGPKIVWRESSLQTNMLPSKIEQKREKERQRKHQRQREREHLRCLNLMNPPQTTYSRIKKVVDSDVNSTTELYLTNNKIVVNNLEINNEIMFKNICEPNKKKLDKKLGPVKVQGRSLLRPRILGRVSGTKFERSKGIDLMEIKESEKSIFAVGKKRPVRYSFQEEPGEKLLILRPIKKVFTRKGKIEKSERKNTRLNIVSSLPNFQNETKEGASMLNLLPARSEIDPLHLEDPPGDVVSEIVNPPSDDESDPLALENPPMDAETKMINSLTENDECDPLAFENSSMDLSADASELITIDSETSDSETSDSETSDSETKYSEESVKTRANAYLSKLRPARRKTYNSNKTVEPNKRELDKKKEDLSLLRVKHTKIHDEGLKTFECTICDKKFNTYMGKMRHLKTHMKK
ncbi:uncharacterized protein LOC117172882 [Belonocnema kinseyi]|uniref:uncharacterized protein LOC117172882 n=1 Tax=Belonocnema kinseyi TaxID=2817044 RepID=UPI00143CF6CE|nr:uncharacterized protein LOC117172882 [Belonocnema kinseyi]